MKKFNKKSVLSKWGAIITVFALIFSMLAGQMPMLDSISDKSVSAAETQTDDTTYPTGKIIIDSSIFETFLNTITFGLFRLGNTTFEIVSSAPSIGYIIAEIPFYNETEALDPSVTWTPYTASVQINANFKGVIYAKLENELNLVTIISSDGLVVYSDSAAVDTEITYYKGSFDDLTAEVELNGNTVSAINDGTANLIPDSHYTVSGDIITFRVSYLESLSVGEYELTISYNPYGVPRVEGENNTYPPDTKIKLIISNPVITIDSQPAANTEFFENEAAVTLEVAASVNAGSVLSYQWFRNSSNSNTGGTAIGGATENKYTPPVTAATVGIRYFYCVVSATGGAVSATSEVATYTVNEKYWTVTFSANNPSWGTVTAQVHKGNDVWESISSDDEVRHGSTVEFTATPETDYRREYRINNGVEDYNNSSNRRESITDNWVHEAVFEEIPDITDKKWRFVGCNNGLLDFGVKGVGYPQLISDNGREGLSIGVHNRGLNGGLAMYYKVTIVNHTAPDAFTLMKAGNPNTYGNVIPISGTYTVNLVNRENGNSDNFFVIYRTGLNPGVYTATINIEFYFEGELTFRNEYVDVIFTVRPSVTLPVNKDGSPWSDHGKKFTLRQGGIVIKTAQLSDDGEVIFGIDDGGVDPGTYNIFDGETDTGETVTVSDGSGNVTADELNYYTVEFSSDIAGTVSESRVSAIYDDVAIDSGAVVLSGKELVITAKGKGADDYKYKWSGAGTRGQITNALTIKELHEKIDALCTVSGEITHYIATVNINRDNTPWAFHGKNFTISNDGGFTHTPLKDNYNGTLSERVETVSYSHHSTNTLIDEFTVYPTTIITPNGWSVHTQSPTVGYKIYSDRDNLIFADIPEILDGTHWIHTANNSKQDNSTVDLAEFIAGEDITVFIMADRRVEQNGYFPAWLNSYAKTDLQAEVLETTTALEEITRYYDIYQKDFKKGEQVVLGANGRSSGSCMYSVFVIEHAPWVIYENGSSTDIEITLDSNSATFNYYTVNFAKNDIGYVIGSSISATYDGVPIVNGAVVPGGKELIITVTAGGTEDYDFNWRGDGTNGENTNILKIENLSDRVNAICDITGAAVTSETTTPETSETSVSESNTTTPDSAATLDSTTSPNDTANSDNTNTTDTGGTTSSNGFSDTTADTGNTTSSNDFNDTTGDMTSSNGFSDTTADTGGTTSSNVSTTADTGGTTSSNVSTTADTGGTTSSNVSTATADTGGTTSSNVSNTTTADTGDTTSSNVSTTTADTGGTTSSNGSTTTADTGGTTTLYSTTTPGSTTTTTPATTTTATTTPITCDCDRADCDICSENGKWYALGNVDNKDGVINGVTIFDALEILKHLVNMNSSVEESEGGRYAAKITLQSRENDEVTIFDALEILKHLVNMTSRIDGIHINGVKNQS